MNLGYGGPFRQGYPESGRTYGRPTHNSEDTLLGKIWLFSLCIFTGVLFGLVVLLIVAISSASIWPSIISGAIAALCMSITLLTDTEP